MRTIVLRNDDERTPGDSSAGEERRVTLFFPVTGDEYKQTRAAVEGVTPVGEEGSGPAGTPAGGRYVVTTDQQRREWGLADLANGPGGAAAPGDPDAMERSGAVSVVDSADALDLLFEDGAGGDVAAAAAGGRRCGRTRPRGVREPETRPRPRPGPRPGRVRGTPRPARAERSGKRRCGPPARRRPAGWPTNGRSRTRAPARDQRPNPTPVPRDSSSTR